MDSQVSETPRSGRHHADETHSKPGNQGNSKNDQPINKGQRIEHVPGSEIQINSKFTVGDPNTKIFSVKFNYEDKYIACACENGTIRVFNTRNGALTTTFSSSRPNIPFSYVRWRPPGHSFKTKNVFVTLNSEGEIQHFHLASGKLLSTIKHDSFDPQLFCLDYNLDTTKFSVCGSEPIIKVYDEETRKLDVKLGGEQTFPPGHSSRVYCVKYDKEDPNVIYTGGWDYRVIIWDLRENKPKKNGIYGPLICGDGIDLYGQYILTSSWTNSNQLQIWDRRNYKLVSDIDWDGTLKTTFDPVFLYSGQFSKADGTLILAGGSNTNEVKLFDRENQNKAFCCITELSREVNTVDFGNEGEMFAFSGGDGLLRVFQMNIKA
ncbi:hypothetical protein ABPG74_007229 [Tetrahymena malaccensis]